MLTLLPILAAMAAAGPPSPPGFIVPLLSPKHAEQVSSLQVVTKPSPAVTPVPLITKPGLLLTLIPQGKTGLLTWQGAAGPYAVEELKQNQWNTILSSTMETNITVPLDGTMGLFRVLTSPVLGRGTLNAPDRICQMTNGLNVYPYSDGTYAKLGTWTQFKDFTAVTVPGVPYFRSVVCAVAGDRIVLADTTLYGTNILYEFQLSGTNLTAITRFGFGVSGSSMASCTVQDKVFTFCCRPSTNESHVYVTSVMRDPDGSYHVSPEIQCDSSTAINEAVIMTAVGFHGLAWLFNTMDSSGCVSLKQFTTSNTLYYANAGFICGDSPPAPSGEMPVATAVVDEFNDHILLGYCSAPSFLCYEPDYINYIYGSNSVVSVSPTRNVSVLATTPWQSLHADYPLLPIFPRSILIDTISERADADGCNTNPGEFVFATLQGGIFTEQSVVVHGFNVDIAGYSPDGWIVYRDGDLFYRLAKY